MILHIVSQSPFSHAVLQRCLQLADAKDSIVLLNDGVLALCQPALLTEILAAGLQVYVIEPDLLARGISGALNTSASIIDYDQFVTLCTEADKTVSWF